LEYEDIDFELRGYGIIPPKT